MGKPKKPWFYGKVLLLIVVLDPLFGFGGAHALVEEDTLYVKKQAKENSYIWHANYKVDSLFKPFLYIFMPLVGRPTGTRKDTSFGK